MEGSKTSLADAQDQIRQALPYCSIVTGQPGNHLVVNVPDSEVAAAQRAIAGIRPGFSSQVTVDVCGASILQCHRGG